MKNKITSLNVVKTALSGGVKLSLLAFSVSVLAAPPVPTLFTPINEETNVPKENINFSWISAGAANYRIVISQNEKFSFVDLNGSSYCSDSTCWTYPNSETGSTILTDDHINHSVLLSGHKYYWAVRANNSTGVSGWAGGSFTTAGNPENPPPLSSVGVAVDWNSSAYKDSNLFWKAGYAPQEFYSDPTSSKLGVAKGNCTWYVNGRLRQLGYDVNSLNKMTGMAKTWRDSAKKAGLVVDKKPTVGSILQTTAGSGGHVAVVEKINADGSLTISESSYVDTNAYPQLAKWDFKYRTRIIPKNKIPGYNYIHVPKGANSGLVFQNNTTTFAYPTLSEFPSLPKPNCEAAHWYSAPGVAEIPCLMTKKGWNYAAGLMSYWFAGAGSNFYISIDDVKKRNSQVQTFINELQDEKLFDNGIKNNKRFYKKYLEDELAKQGRLTPKKGEVIYFDHIADEYQYFKSNPGYQDKDTESSHLYYVATRSFTDGYMPTEFNAAFGASSLKLVTKGYVTLVGNNPKITITEGAVYFKDSYDFRISKIAGFIEQPLGCWGYIAPYLSSPAVTPNLCPDMASTYVNNTSFRTYNTDNGFPENHGEFRIVSLPEKFTYTNSPNWIVGQ